MRIAVVAESRPGEARVACVPETVAPLIGLGHRVLVEPGAGRGVLVSDEDYVDAGAEIVERPWLAAELVLSVQPLDEVRRAELGRGTATLSFFPAALLPAELTARRDAGLTTFAFDSLPRTARAQPMDALTSQALVAGYRGAVVAFELLREFPSLIMTAAGTIPPAQVLVLGAGVAGLQAIATARRLGAMVSGSDVRPSSAEEIASLGAIPIDLGFGDLADGSGYARESSSERIAEQRRRLAPHVVAADAVITTAAVPGRTAPVLIDRATLESMRPGSAIVDLVADAGGNVEGAQPGQTVRIGRTQVWGGENVAAQMPRPASRLYARNVLDVVTLLTRDGALDPDFDDELVAGMCLTHAGEFRTSVPTESRTDG